MTFGQKASLYWALGAGRFWQTAGLFLMGLYIGRKQLFVTSEKHTRFWVKALIISAISFAPLFQLLGPFDRIVVHHTSDRADRQAISALQEQGNLIAVAD